MYQPFPRTFQWILMKNLFVLLCYFIVTSLFATVARDTFIEELPKWEPVGTGLNNDVHVIKEHNGLLYVAGKFINAGGNSAADRIAIWNGTAWLPLGAGLNHAVQDILIMDTLIYACGGFTDAGGDPDADYVAVWNGQKWGSVAGGRFSDWVMCLEADTIKKTIYAGGFFKAISGDSTISHIAQFRQGSWSKLGQGLNGVVYDMVYSNNYLHAGGAFNNVGKYFSKYDGIDWLQTRNEDVFRDTTASGSQPTVRILQMTADKRGDILMTLINGATSGYVAIYRGDSLVSQGGYGFCLPHAIEANQFGYFLGVSTVLGTCGGRSFAGSLLFNTDPYVKRNLLLSDETPFTGTFFTIEYTKSGNLYVGGSFGNLGGAPKADHIACTKGIFNTSATKDVTTNSVQIHLYPNPTSDLLKATVTNLQNTYETSVRIYDVSGVLIKSTMLDSLSQGLDISGLPTGCYFVVITLQDGALIHKKFVVAR
jgi:Secretion system C-terminal sorting domain